MTPENPSFQQLLPRDEIQFLPTDIGCHRIRGNWGSFLGPLWRRTRAFLPGLVTRHGHRSGPVPIDRTIDKQTIFSISSLTD